MRHLTTSSVALRATSGDDARARWQASAFGKCRGVKPVGRRVSPQPERGDDPSPESYADIVSLRANKGTHEWAQSRPTGEKRGETPEPKGVRRACKANSVHDRHQFLRREVGKLRDSITLDVGTWELLYRVPSKGSEKASLRGGGQRQRRSQRLGCND